MNWLREGARGREEILRDLAWIMGLALLVLAAGLGLRDPWPADEPRFALVARDMVVSGQWLFPAVGGDYYPDKPPVFFWTIGFFYWLTGSLRVAFLLPCLLGGLGTLALVYDLARRLWSREVGLAAALVLLATFQFALQARTAQIDGLLVFLTTLGLYGIARHLLLGPSWRWYVVGGFAAGLGVITKGVGFLPLLVLLPYWLLRRRGFAFAGSVRGRWRWLLAPVAALAAIALWFVPMVLAVSASGDSALLAYRDEILLHQTVTRYAAAWHHHEPFWFFLVNVIPGLWLPVILLLPWLVPRWRAAWRDRDPRALLFLGWVLVVVLFFSLSSGKRGVYILPALPAFVLAAAPWLPALWRQPRVQHLGAVLTGVLALIFFGVVLYLGVLAPQRAAEIEANFGVQSLAPFVVLGVLAAGLLLLCRWRYGMAAFAATLWCGFILQGWWINPMLNDARSARGFMTELQKGVPANVELGMLAYREQFLLYVDRPIVNFGHARWREGAAEAHDAARWLNERPGRVLLVEDDKRARCFADSPATAVNLYRERWFLVRAPADAKCAEQGKATAARLYDPARGF